LKRPLNKALQSVFVFDFLVYIVSEISPGIGKKRKITNKAQAHA
jgi:hypothetical protein